MARRSCAVKLRETTGAVVFPNKGAEEEDFVAFLEFTIEAVLLVAESSRIRAVLLPELIGCKDGATMGFVLLRLEVVIRCGIVLVVDDGTDNVPDEAGAAALEPSDFVIVDCTHFLVTESHSKIKNDKS